MIDDEELEPYQLEDSDAIENVRLIYESHEDDPDSVKKS